jgi:hypothetical protein
MCPDTIILWSEWIIKSSFLPPHDCHSSSVPQTLHTITEPVFRLLPWIIFQFPHFLQVTIMPSEDFFSAISVSPGLKLSSRHNEFLNWSCHGRRQGSKSIKIFKALNAKYFDYPTVFFILEAGMIFSE